ncbi:MAG: hypothetical protein RSD14_00455 [Clostridia bacterium]
MKNKKGISLIVLVITIIVIIILAAAVILTLNKNNPMNNSKIATLAQNKDSIESGINMYLAQKIANTQGKYTASEILTKKGPTDEEIAVPLVSGAAVTVKINGQNGTPATTAYLLSDANVKSQTDITLPGVPTNSNWYIDPETSKVYLIFTATTDYPAYITDSIASNTTLQQFVGIK